MRADPSTFRAFRQLNDSFFVIPDAWDLLSAVLMQHSGYQAVCTTSAGLGFMLGCPGSNAISADEMLGVVSGICRAVTIPVCVDLESGYADTAAGVYDVTAAVIDAGAVGVTIEDSVGIPGKQLRDPAAHAERIAAARRAADDAGVPLLILGRTDVFWIGRHGGEEPPEDAKCDDAISRARLYVESGADGAFLSSFRAIEKDSLIRMVREIQAPVASLLGRPGGPTLKDFESMGVRRVHLGSLPTRAQIGFVRSTLAEFRETGDPATLHRHATPTAEINAMLRPYWDAHDEKGRVEQQ